MCLLITESGPAAESGGEPRLFEVGTYRTDELPGLGELVELLDAIVRRAGEPAAGPGRWPSIGPRRQAGPVLIDLDRRAVSVHGRPVGPLTRKEFDLLVLLVSRPTQVLSRDLIMREVWGYDGAGDTRTLGVHMAGLRRKLGEPRLIETVRGVGFRFIC